MEGNSAIIYLACLIIIFIVGKLFFLPIKSIVKLLINSILGGILIYIVNIVGISFNFHLGLNFGTAVFSGLFGIPGVICLIVLKCVV